MSTKTASLLTDMKMPFCPGCGYHLSTRVLAKAIEKAGIHPLDVVVVSDIGCCGLIDGLLQAHTVHGLHGRAAALAFGIAQGLADPTKKVIAIQGDGGATIGLQHLLEAARRNVDMTLLVHNNMVYGMTGGQVSGLSPEPVKDWKMPDEKAIPPFDVVELARAAGAAYSGRIIERGDYTDVLADAIQTRGFSLLEIVGPCPAHGIGKIKDIAGMALQDVTYRNDREPHVAPRRETQSLFSQLRTVEADFQAKLQGRFSLIVAGSAGEGVQSAADLLANAAVASGLHATKKGDYPVTVGTGFSIAEVILSSEAIHHTGIEQPDVAMIVSEDGLGMMKTRLTDTKIVLDATLSWPDAPGPVEHLPFRKTVGGKGAALGAIAYWLRQTGILPMDALSHVAAAHKLGDKFLAIIEKAAAL